MNTDEGTGFLDDMTKKEVKHESDISLMNQLFDGKGDVPMCTDNGPFKICVFNSVYLYSTE